MTLVILDRDGVINRDSDAYIKTPDEWLPLPGSIAAIAALCAAGFTVSVATNQSGIARGYITRDVLAAMHLKMTRLVAAAGGRIAHIAHCPHGPDDGCECRKPQPGLIDQTLTALKIPEQAARWMVGDSLGDLRAGAARGCNLVLVRTGKGERTIAASTEDIPSHTHIVADLAAAAELIVTADAGGENPAVSL